jgi:hypothetical protein
VGEELECRVDIAGHRDIAGTGSVIPVKGEIQVLVVRPVSGEFVEGGESVDEMLGIGELDFDENVFYGYE